MMVKIRKATGHRITCTDLYEMRLEGSKWYFIHRKNIETKGPTELARALFNSCLLGLTAGVSGCYNRETKKLVLVL